MRRFTVAPVLLMAVLLPNLGTAQVFVRPNPYPQVTAANAVWQMTGEPVFHAGAFYYPTGPTLFFDGNVMQRTGTVQGVPLYEDATLEPFSVVYVPIGGNVVRPYERPRAGDLVGTTGSRTPSFPIQRDGDLSVAAGTMGITGWITPQVSPPPVVMAEAPRPIGTAGIDVTTPPPAPDIPSSMPTGQRVVIGSVPPPGTPDGVWVPYDGARWYSAGPSVAYSPDRFVRVGEYQGFPVYRATNRNADEIYIPSVAGGPVAPYAKR